MDRLRQELKGYDIRPGLGLHVGGGHCAAHRNIDGIPLPPFPANHWVEGREGKGSRVAGQAPASVLRGLRKLGLPAAVLAGMIRNSVDAVRSTSWSS